MEHSELNCLLALLKFPGEGKIPEPEQDDLERKQRECKAAQAVCQSVAHRPEKTEGSDNEQKQGHEQHQHDGLFYRLENPLRRETGAR